MSSIKNLSNKEAFVLTSSLILIALLYLGAIKYAYLDNRVETVEFKVFQTYVDYWPDIRKTQTQVLTWGTGKYYFIGTWSDNFQPNHSYRVTYLQKGATQRPWQNLIILEWEEIL